MWNDNDTKIDLIDFSHLIDSTVNIIKDDNLIPCTVGIYGDWGSGKSSLVRMIENRFESKSDILTIKFNGWLFEGYDDAKSVLMKTILEQIILNRTLENNAKAIAKRLLKQIDWMNVAKSAVKHGAAFLLTGGIGNIALGVNDLVNLDTEKIKGAVSGIADNFSDGKYDSYIENIKSQNNETKTFQSGIREFHEDFTQLLSETKIKKLIVFIDDLDRCTPDTVISTLEAIKLFLFVPKSSFVICADERLIKYAIRRRFPEILGLNAEVGRDYLEKLIQYPIRIPSMDSLEMETYINLLFCEINLTAEKFEDIRSKVMENKKKELFSSILNLDTINKFYEGSDIPEKLKEDLFLSSQITPLLTSGLNGNPRQCKRFLNMLLVRFEMAKSKGVNIQKSILAKLMLLEYFRQETFRSLSYAQAEQDGLPKEIVYAEASLSGSKDKIEDLKIDIDTLLTDDWFKKWLNIEPVISGVDLRPYFYFSRDSLGAVTAETSRMSSKSQEVYKKLINESKAIVKGAISEVSELSSSDAISIFNSLSSRIRQEGNIVRSRELIKTLVRITDSQESLKLELITFLSNLPVRVIEPAIIFELKKIIKDPKFSDSLTKLITQWSESENTTLAKIAKKNI